MSGSRSSAAAVALFTIALSQANARETDQFSPPSAPLHDLGPELSRKIVSIIEADRTGRAPDQVLAGWIGHNVFASRIVRWVNRVRAPGEQVRFRPKAHSSIYRVAFSPALASFLIDSPTIRVHGHYMGTDKLDHIFQQGHLYFELARRHEARGKTHEQAIALAVAYGVKQEHSYFGTLMSGVYSNGDLAANYAGMKFYQNLQSPVRIGDRTLPPMFEHTSDGWRLRPGLSSDRILEPFVSDHLDESLNPSRFRFSRASIRSAVRSRCEAWTQFYADRLDLVAPSGESFATTWFGENYGHWLPRSNEISIATECSASIAAIRQAKHSSASETF